MPSDLKSQLATIISQHPTFDFLEEEHSFIHELMADVPMVIKNIAEVHYERAGGLMSSYHESGHSPLFVVSKTRDIIGVLSQSKILTNGKTENIYYSSDLRIQPQSDRRSRLQFRNVYSDIVQLCEGRLYTCILDRNTVAVNSLTRSKTYAYNPYIRYSSYSLLVTPLMRLAVGNGLTMHKLSADEAFAYARDFSSTYDFIQFDSNHPAYCLKDGTQIIAVFTIQRPVFRKTVVKPLSIYAKACLAAASLIFKKDYSKQLPWVYLTSLILKDQKLLSLVTQALLSLGVKQGLFKYGELLQLLGPRELKLDFLSGPKIVVDGTMYSVTQEKAANAVVAQNFSLSPMGL